jgi:hypothetical protein
MSGVLVSIACITSASLLSPLEIAGVGIGALSLLVTAYLVTERRLYLYVTVVLATLASLPIVWFRIRPGSLPLQLVNWIYALDLALWALLTLTTTLIVFHGIMTARRVGSNEIFGAIYVYLLIGILFAQIYQLLLVAEPAALYFDPARFPAPLQIGNGLYARSSGDLVYYSFVTLGTVGYGDVTPAIPVARLLSLIEAVIGIMYVATMIARFVSIQTNGDDRRDRRGEAS